MIPKEVAGLRAAFSNAESNVRYYYLACFNDSVVTLATKLL